MTENDSSLFSVDIENYNGPLDILLDLAKSQKVNLENISINLSASKGRIEDADFAVETGNLAKGQILQQAATAMLAQANASKQQVLTLIR